MYRSDYILRVIERFARALIGVRNRLLKQGDESAESLPSIHEIATDAGLDLTVARSLDPRSLLMWLAPTGEIDAGRLWLMAELLYLEALRGRAERTDSWRGDAERALAIESKLEENWGPGLGLATPAERIRELREMLAAAPSRS
jgi:hypothetical protein